MIKSKKSNRGMLKVLSCLLLCFVIVFSCGVVAFADDTPRDTLVDAVSGGGAIKADDDSGYSSPEVKDKKYKKTGGGTVTYGDLFTSDGLINENLFLQLTSKEQSNFVSDVANRSMAAAHSSTNAGVTEETVEDWWKELQSIDGVGSKFMGTILENTKPDWVSANRIYKPFSGIVGTVLGLIAVVGMGFLGIVLVADIFYITIPPIRMFVAAEGDKDGTKIPVSKIFSHDAMYAVQVSEDSKEGNGSPKQALGVYFTRRVPMLILLGICLMYLVQGQIYVLVSMVLDLVSGFIGF